jgi:hypothetical protein
MLGGVSLVFSLIMRETYAPVILRKKAARLRKETGDERWHCRYDYKVPLIETMKTNLSRPFVMAVLEPIWYENSSIPFPCRKRELTLL